MLASFFLLLQLPFSLADHKAKLSFQPDAWPYEAVEKVLVKVSNLQESKDAIIKVEIFVPEEENVTLYKVQDDFTLPSGWVPSLSFKGGEIYTITFSSQVGLLPGETSEFWMNSVKAPKQVGSFKWKWITTDAKGETVVGFVETRTTFAELAEFRFEEVPSEQRAGESFEALVIAVDVGGKDKEDYVGEITISSTDKKALIEPKTYKFKLEDKGRLKVNITYQTKGSQTFSVMDEKANVTSTSPSTLVLPKVPLNLKISLPEVVSETRVTLKLQAENALECRYSNDGIIWSDYLPYVEEKEWELLPGEGAKVVYYQCRNEDGESEVVRAVTQLKLIAYPAYLVYAALAISVVALLVAFLRPREIIRKRKREES